MIRRAFLRRMAVAALATAFVDVPIPSDSVLRPSVGSHAWIARPRVYGSDSGRDLEAVMQDILDDWAPGASLSVPESPDFVVLPYIQGSMSVPDALQMLADMIGWEVEWDVWAGPRLVEPERHRGAFVA